jgi:glycosyltransferase involved in cell wall biosynthesis
LRLLRDAFRLARTLSLVRPDVVQLNPSLNRAAVRELLSLTVVRSLHRGQIVLFNHGWNARWPTMIARHPLWRALARFVCARVDLICVLSDKARQEVLAWGIPAHKVLATTTMCDAQAYLVQPRREATGELRLLFLSRLIPGKGADELIRAFDTLAEEFPTLHLTVAGDGEAAANLRTLAAASRHAGRIDFPGFVSGEDKARLLAGSGLFVFPSHLAEGFPVSLLEAMAAGLPILASSVGGIVDLFSSGAQGQALSPQPKAAELQEVLRAWLQCPHRWGAMGETNRQLVRERYDAPAWALRLEQQIARTSRVRE